MNQSLPTLNKQVAKEIWICDHASVSRYSGDISNFKVMCLCERERVCLSVSISLSDACRPFFFPFPLSLYTCEKWNAYYPLLSILLFLIHPHDPSPDGAAQADEPLWRAEEGDGPFGLQAERERRRAG